MVDKKFSDLADNTTPADGDLFANVDVSDTSSAPTGTTKTSTLGSVRASIFAALTAAADLVLGVNRSVGIGTASPDANSLHIQGGTNPSVKLEETAGSYGLLVNTYSGETRLSHNTAIGGAFVAFDPMPADGTSAAQVQMFRNTASNSAQKKFTIFAGDGTPTEEHRFTVDGGGNSVVCISSGDFQIGSNFNPSELHMQAGSAIGIGTTTPAVDGLHVLGGADPSVRLEETAGSCAELKNVSAGQSQINHEAQTGNSLLILDSKPLDGAGVGQISLFRFTNTTGEKQLLFAKGDGLGTIQHQLTSDGPFSSFCLDNGDLKLGSGSNPAELLLHNGTKVLTGSGAPEGVATAPPGSDYKDATNGKAYVKSSGTGNTGWSELTTGAAIALTNYTVVESPSDLPAPSGGYHTLTPGVWRVNGNLSMTDKIRVADGAYLIGAIAEQDGLTWVAGTGPFIEFEGSGTEEHHSHNLTFAAVGGAAGQDLFGQYGGGVPLRLIMHDAATVGNIGDVSSSGLTLFRDNAHVAIGTGFQFTGTNKNFVVRSCTINGIASGSAALFDLGTATFDLFSVDDCNLSPGTGQYAIDALGSNGNLTTTTGRGEVKGTRFNGSGLNLTGGISIDDLQWGFSLNAGQGSSLAYSAVEMVSNLTATNIVSTGVFYAISGTFVSAIAKRFTNSATGGTMTYNGLTSRAYKVEGLLSMQMVSGGAKSITLQVHKNGSPVGVPITQDVPSSQLEVGVRAIVPDVVATDVLDIRVRNNDDTTNVLIVDYSADATAVPTGV